MCQLFDAIGNPLRRIRTRQFSRRVLHAPAALRIREQRRERVTQRGRLQLPLVDHHRRSSRDEDLGVLALVVVARRRQRHQDRRRA